MTRFVLLACASLLCLAACKGGGQTDVGSKEDAFEGANIKADCFDCDVSDLRSAFEQADLGRTGFLRKSTTWEVAFQHRVDRRNEKHVLGPDEVLGAGSLGDIYLYSYTVTQLETRVFGDYKRPVAHIEITQAASPGGYAGLVSSDRVDTFEYKVVLLMNDLFEGVAKVYYNGRYPNGRYVEQGDGSVRAAMDPFPSDVPDVMVANTEVRPLPTLSPALTAVGDKAMELGRLPADWKTRDNRYFKFEQDGGFEEVYWAAGDLWPTFVSTTRGEALLVRQLEP